MDNPEPTNTARGEAHGLSLRAVESVAQAGSWYTDLERGETEWSRMVGDLFGVSPSEASLDHEDVAEFVVPEHVETVEQKRAALFDGEPFDIEYRIEVDGSTTWIHERAEVTRDDEGDPIAAIGVLQDVTEQKESVRDVERFRTLVDKSCDGLFIVESETGEILDVNDAACDLLGYDRDELRSLSVSEINPAVSPEMWRDFAAALRDDGTEVLETEHEREDGATFPVEIHTSHVPLDREYHVATVRDITERKEREKQLESARKRYRTLIEAAPDPIFVADAETGELVEANAAAASLRQQPRDEIVGLPQTALHPDDETDRYRDLFVHHVERSGTISEFDDGTPLYLTTVDGDPIPVAISTKTVTLDDRTLIHGIFRDISEQRQYENALSGINTAARELLHAETDAEIAQIVVDVASDVLDVSGAAVYLYDDGAEELVPAAYSARLDDILDETPRFSPGEGVAWRVFADQEPERFDDVRAADRVYNAGTPIRSELLLSLGEHGVLLVGDSAVGGFDEAADEIAETLAATAEAALDHAGRAQAPRGQERGGAAEGAGEARAAPAEAALDHAGRAQALRAQEREAQLQAQRLERVNQLNDQIRTIMQALMEADSRDEIARHVCDSLVSLDGFASVWIGEPDATLSGLRIAAHDGTPRDYPERVSLELAADNTLPAVRAALSRTTVAEPRIASNPLQTAWRNAALLSEFRSVISVPLLYDELLYGVLTIYSDRPAEFDERAQSVLTELGHLVGYALNATDQRNALLGTETVDVTFNLTNCTDVFFEFAGELSTEVSIENITSRSENTYLVHFACEAVGTERVQAAVENSPSISELRVISESDPSQYEAVVVGDCLVATLATMGANIRSAVVSGTGCHISASLPEERERQRFVEHLKDAYPDIDVAIQRQTGSPSVVSGKRLLDRALTDRQRDVLQTTYYSGFFDRQRKRNGSEIADSLDVSQPAFSTRLRAAQRNLFSEIFDG